MSRAAPLPTPSAADLAAAERRLTPARDLLGPELHARMVRCMATAIARRQQREQAWRQRFDPRRAAANDLEDRHD